MAPESLTVFKAVISACVDCVYFGTNFMGVKTFLREWVLRDKKGMFLKCTIKNTSKSLNVYVIAFSLMEYI